jgi:hypothetical protein
MYTKTVVFNEFLNTRTKLITNHLKKKRYCWRNDIHIWYQIHHNRLELVHLSGILERISIYVPYLAFIY